MKILLANLIFTLLIFANSETLDTKVVNGVEYSNVKSKTVVENYNSSESELLEKNQELDIHIETVK